MLTDLAKSAVVLVVYGVIMTWPDTSPQSIHQEHRVDFQFIAKEDMAVFWQSLLWNHKYLASNMVAHQTGSTSAE